ncbi:2-oxoglutarate ferredoxin oxidoreductase subunit gamma [Candidatus Falkowbacteria bacterium RIFCSPLOWO2_12_FULL_45_13]|uniref:2-oxoglutarate ferredoxin oxidoreductase subunit gamma n=2 Tax=Bacteria TaxID=2 RepID=A0A1F4RDV1_UNCSA|nr:MAG: 2-oxoglutarate ferredoxin oxidoreductase subunit gamma [candidate division WOR-1 bacterium RIFCSPLOWO2_02_FULL_46_20]OGF32020.1 MAG: 2-oxoglutarate ferredoxin oxidoreductase subunit gamma [Candidatus Falkowbacteria bacterium RIFCSPLOWO2_12_FULL_45_13]
MRFEICLSGHGGQGMVLGGKILAEAIALYQDKHVVQTQSYGPEARGGASRSEIVVSDEEIDYPKVTQLNLLLALSQESCDKYSVNLESDGILIIDPLEVKSTPKGNFKVYSIPIIQLAKNELGKTLFANIIALGAIAAISGIVNQEELTRTVLKHVPEKTKEDNQKALELGYRTGQTAIK